MTGPTIASRVVGTIRMAAESHRGRVVRKNVIIALTKAQGAADTENSYCGTQSRILVPIEGRRKSSGDFLPPSPPAEKATARQEQAKAGAVRSLHNGREAGEEKPDKEAGGHAGGVSGYNPAVRP